MISKTIGCRGTQHFQTNPIIAMSRSPSIPWACCGKVGQGCRSHRSGSMPWDESMMKVIPNHTWLREKRWQLHPICCPSSPVSSSQPRDRIKSMNKSGTNVWGWLAIQIPSRGCRNYSYSGLIIQELTSASSEHLLMPNPATSKKARTMGSRYAPNLAFFTGTWNAKIRQSCACYS